MFRELHIFLVALEIIKLVEHKKGENITWYEYNAFDSK